MRTVTERSQRRYRRPPWFQRHVGNRLAPLFNRSVLSKLSVPGRRSGRWRTTPVAVRDYKGERYLVSYRGESEWVRNLRASSRARLNRQGEVEEITVSEIPVGERANHGPTQRFQGDSIDVIVPAGCDDRRSNGQARGD
jgi:deazaflavin-dependent oxidoreductase (nitroreductase family)